MEDDTKYFQNPQKDIRHLLPKIKSLLTTRNTTTQIKAANYLLNVLKDDAARTEGSTKLSDFVVKQDIIGFLCEAMSTTNCHLLEIVVNILVILSASVELAGQGDSLCVVEAALRATHILAPLTTGSDGQQAPDRVHAATLRLIAVVLRRWTKVRRGRPVSEVCRTEQLLSAVNRVVSPEAGSAPLGWPQVVVLAAGDALAALVLAVAQEAPTPAPLKHKTLTLKSPATLIPAINLTLDGIQGLHGEGALHTLCRLAEAAVRYSCYLEGIEKAGSEEGMFEGQSFVFLKNIVTRITDGVLVKEQAPEMTLSVVSFLASVMEVPISAPLRSSLAHRLSAKGFLAILPQMITDCNIKTKSSKYFSLEIDNVSRSGRRDAQSAGRRLLVSLLTTLAADLLPESSLFEASRLAVAAAALPINVDDWGSQIALATSWAETRALVLLWAYCRCLCSKSLQEIRLLGLSLLPSLCCYLTRFTELHLLAMPRALLKSIWFIFATLSLSSDTKNAGARKTPSSSLVEATERLLFVLRSHQNLKPVYTHNPAMLYWVFTTSCAELQTAVVMLWLEQENTAVGLGDLVRTRREVAFRLLDVVQTGSAVVATRASAVLDLALTGAGNAGGGSEEAGTSERFRLATTIWSILPGVLAQVMESSMGAARADCMLKLAHRAAVLVSGAATLDGCGDLSGAVAACGGSVVRTARQLAPLLASSSPECPPPVFQGSGLQVALFLLKFTQHQADSRVFTIFSEYHSLTRTLVSSVMTQFKEAPGIVEISARVLTAILDCQKLFGLPFFGEVATIPAERVVLLLQQPAPIPEAIVGVLQAQLELQCILGQPLVQFENATPLFWRALFLRLQMLCSKDIAEISLPAWKILTRLLSSNICDSATLRHLATQPWTHLLLRMTFASGPSTLDLALERDTENCVKTPPEEVTHFILAWLKAPREKQHRFITSPSPDMLTETCCVIGAALVQWTSNGLCSNIDEAIARQLLSCGASLPQDTTTGLQKLLELPDVQKLSL